MDIAPVQAPPPPRPPPPSRPPSTSTSTSTSRAAPPPPPPPPPRSAPASEPNPSAPICLCGKPSMELTVKKESANKGRHFRRCGQPEGCGFFEWADEPPRNRDAAGTGTGTGMKRGLGGGGGGGGGPPNPPSIPAKRTRADDAVRLFCPFFFLLFHELHALQLQVTKRYCQCDLTAVLKIVKKEGANQGRHYWSCPNSQAAACKFFEWEDDPASAVIVAPLNTRTQSAGSQQTNGECFNVSI